MSENQTLLGATYRDVITGFEGIAIGRVEYLSGCNQVLLQPRVGEDGSFKDSLWLDEQRLVLNGMRSFVALANGDSPGFDKAAPKR